MTACESKTGQSAPCPAESRTPTQMVRGWGADRERSGQRDTASPPVCRCAPACITACAPRSTRWLREEGTQGARGLGQAAPAVASAHRLDRREKGASTPRAPGGAAGCPRTVLPGAALQGAGPSLAG